MQKTKNEIKNEKIFNRWLIIFHHIPPKYQWIYRFVHVIIPYECFSSPLWILAFYNLIWWLQFVSVTQPYCWYQESIVYPSRMIVAMDIHVNCVHWLGILEFRFDERWIHPAPIAGNPHWNVQNEIIARLQKSFPIQIVDKWLKWIWLHSQTHPNWKIQIYDSILWLVRFFALLIQLNNRWNDVKSKRERERKEKKA